MDRSALNRTRMQEAPHAQPTRSPANVSRSRATVCDQRTNHGTIRTAKDSGEITRARQRPEEVELGAMQGHTGRMPEEDSNSPRHFTVGNVGAGGTLYLKPSRMPAAPNFTVPLQTPPGTADGVESLRTIWPGAGARQSEVPSGAWTPRARGSVYDNSVPVPPLSLANAHPKRRPRSYSFSTLGEQTKSPAHETGDFQFLLNGQDTTHKRPKSSLDLGEGLLKLHIPNYRLGTPQFSDRGTAYLHNSVYTTNTNDDMRSSVFSRGEFDKLFPAPPGRRTSGHPGVSRQASSPYLLPSRYSATPTRSLATPPVSIPSPPATIHPGLFDKIEANPNDPSIVRFAATSGRIVAATPARLVSQITSPKFLDYELLSDFFLTFRGFMSCQELLEYLLARMKWALANLSDSGRIVRVRTFVALRHWVLNYFGDDFLTDYDLRRRFCDRVNHLAVTLSSRDDHGGSDLNIVGELKKCWRRTCALYWPVPDAMDPSPELDIVPGGEQDPATFAASAVSLPLSLRQNWPGDSHQAAVVAKKHSPKPEAEIQGHQRQQSEQGIPDTIYTRNTSTIPATPMSEDSLQVLSCSVPFLRHCMPHHKDGKKASPRPAQLQKNPAYIARPAQPHKRSGSFSDALRDERAPLPSTKGEDNDTLELPSTTFTSGLVRGLLLQPSPAKVGGHTLSRPAMEQAQSQPEAEEDAYYDEASNRHLAIKRVVGDVRRALSNRRPHGESPTSTYRSNSSSGSRGSVIHHRPDTAGEKQTPSSGTQQHRPPARIDVLGSVIMESYSKAFQGVVDDNEEDQEQTPQPEEKASDGVTDEAREQRPEFDRMASHLTTSSQSILIVDDTGPPPMPTHRGMLPSVSSTSSGMTPLPLFRMRASELEQYGYLADVGSSKQQGPTGDEYRSGSSDAKLNNLLALPDGWPGDHLDLEREDSLVPRKSSSTRPAEANTIPNPLRRRPGGNLKAADHVHELETLPRPYTAGSASTISRYSEAYSRGLSGTHFSGQNYTNQLASFRLPASHGLSNRRSSQPYIRPSFEAEAADLARIREVSSGGGVEDALLKLEGKYAADDASVAGIRNTSRASSVPRISRQWPKTPVDDRQAEAGAEHALKSPQTDRQGASIYHLSDYSNFSDGIPLSVSEWTDGNSNSTAPVLPLPSRNSIYPIRTNRSPSSSNKSVAFAPKPETIEPQTVYYNKNAIIKTEPKSAASQGSFLLDDNESLSDISTEIADAENDDTLGVRSFFFDDTVEDEAVVPQPFRPPPSPPSTVGQPPTQSSPERNANYHYLADKRSRQLKEAASAPKVLSAGSRHVELERPSDLRRVRTAPSHEVQTDHLPFVLGFDAEIIAEQLTIIEKDALDEVDWKDLIARNWKHNPPVFRNWVNYLTSGADGNGIDLVIARFNLVVKWVVSEIVLTTAPSERARTIIKYIHIATHALRLRNYASTYQLTLALLSSNLACLRATWTLVPPAEKQMLARLENLCQPLRNFQNLRADMEAAASPDQLGCIPFIGLYTHDLMYNAQKPAHIDASPPSSSAAGGEQLVNFDRFQTAATITKSLLRLLEASSRYIFRPHPEALSRCLWLAALEDVEIAARIKDLE